MNHTFFLILLLVFFFFILHSLLPSSHSLLSPSFHLPLISPRHVFLPSFPSSYYYQQLLPPFHLIIIITPHADTSSFSSSSLYYSPAISTSLHLPPITLTQLSPPLYLLIITNQTHLPPSITPAQLLTSSDLFFIPYFPPPPSLFVPQGNLQVTM